MFGRAALVLAVGVVGMGWSAPLIRFALEAGAPALAVAALRLTFAAPVMMGAAAGSRVEDLRRLGVREWALLVLSAAGLAAHFGLWVASLERTSIAASVVLVTTQPLFVGIGAWLFLRERPAPRVIVGTVVAFAGALVLASDDWGDAGTQFGNLLALGGAVGASLYVVIGRTARQYLSLRSYTASVYTLTAAMLLLVAVVSETPLLGLEPRAYAFIVAVAVVSQLIGHNAINWSLATFPAAVVAVAILGEPAVAVVVAGLLLDEVPTLLEVVGGAVVLGGVYVALRKSRPALPAAPTSPEGAARRP